MVHWLWLILLADLEWFAKTGLMIILIILLGFWDGRSGVWCLRPDQRRLEFLSPIAQELTLAVTTLCCHIVTRRSGRLRMEAFLTNPFR
jgi:hypothetical protein